MKIQITWRMKVLVSYSGRNQVFNLEENDAKHQMRDLEQKVSLYFKIASNAKVILQRYDKEWDSYLDLDEGDILQDRDRLKVTIECTPTGRDLDTSLKTQLDSKATVILQLHM